MSLKKSKRKKQFTYLLMPLLRNKGAKLELILWAQHGDWLSPFIVGQTFTCLFIRRIRSAFRQLGDTPLPFWACSILQNYLFWKHWKQGITNTNYDVSRLRVNYAIHELYMILNREHDLGVKLKHKIFFFFFQRIPLGFGSDAPLNMGFLNDIFLRKETVVSDFKTITLEWSSINKRASDKGRHIISIRSPQKFKDRKMPKVFMDYQNTPTLPDWIISLM